MSYEISNIINSIINADCYEVLKQLPDKSVDLVLTDPPYGIGAGKGTEIYLSNNGKQEWGDIRSNKHTIYGEWDNSVPSPEFFAEIKRVSKNQIVWGGNYFCQYLKGTSCWLVWDKLNGESFFADAELAYTSFNSKVRVFKYLSCGFMGSHKNRDVRIHPTQKPVPLFKWCLTNYSKPGDLILDPMCGSGTTALACHALGRRYICIDKESDYVEAARKRLLQFQAQGDLFAGENSALAEENQTSTQQSLYASAEYRLRATPH